jgi:Ca2+-binding RTX toxin-like protein
LAQGSARFIDEGGSYPSTATQERLMALGFFMVPPGYAGPVPPGYTEVFYTNTAFNDGSAFDDIVIGSDIGAKWFPLEGYDILDYSGFDQGITISEVEGTVRDANGIIGQISAIQGVGFEEYRGTAFDDVLIAASGDAVALHGNGGNDRLVGGTNAELLDGGAGIDTASYANSTVAVTVDLRLSGAQVSAGDANGDTLTGIENLTGSIHNDSLHGDAGTNVLIGGAGADALVGGGGIDTAEYSASPAGVTVDLVLGTGHGGDAEGDTLTGIENITGSALADHLSGDAGVNVLLGGAGDDTLRGGAGADHLDGGAGSDFANYQDSAAAVTVDLLAHTNSGGDAQGDTLTSIENLVGSAFSDKLTGDGLDNTLTGGAGNDGLVGGGGADHLVGGDGLLDVASYSDSTVAVTVDLSLGTGHGGDAEGDTLSGIEGLDGSAFDDSLIGDGGTNLLAGEMGDDRLVGGAGDDALIGDSDLSADNGDDVLVGGAGADQLYGDFPGGSGDTGIDTADYSASAAGVTVDLISGTGLGGDAQGDTLFQIDNLVGSAFADHLTGDANANGLSGGAGNDTLRGGAGADALDGGDGSDFANYQGSATAVTVDLLAHTNSGGDAQGDTLTSIENLYGSSNDDHLSGDDGRNVIGGENGNDVLVGNGGGDAMNGEAGNDSLDGGDGNDRLVGGAGIDLIHGGTGNDSIDAGSENDQVFGDAGNDSLYGGTGDDQIDGGDGNDVLEGAAGADALTGGVGSDTASYASSATGVTVSLAGGTGTGGDAEGDTLTGIENLAGSAQADHLTGDETANALSGGTGDDVLTGGSGADLLRGGAGNDSFTYTGIADSTVTAAGKDTIVDFTTGDHIDLSAIDADGNEANGDTAFSFGTGAFTGHAGELRVVTVGAVQVVYADTNGDRIADFAINVLSDHALTVSDFVL